MKKNKPFIIIFGLILVVAMVQLACNLPEDDTPTEDSPGLIHTIAAQTVEAQLTEQASGQQPTQSGQVTEPTVISPTAAPTNTPGGNPTSTQAAATNTPAAGNSPTPTSTQVPCNSLTFVKDVSIQDNTEIDPGETFEKIWRLKNTGSCTWNSDYRLVFVDGDQMGAPDSQSITSGTIEPGEEVDVMVEMKAPTAEGTYQGYFKLKSDNGVIFGAGSSSKAFWAKIEVPEATGIIFDFIARADDAEWGSGRVPVEFDKPGETELDFGGPDTDSDGFAMIKKDVELENGKTYNRVLETYPKDENKGYIVGKFPTYSVRSGDRLQGSMGFLAEADGSCGSGDAIFEIFYTIDDDEDSLERLGKWEETCDGTLQVIDLDLSFLRGDDVEFYLVIRANGATDQDWAVWQGLIIER